ncbi:MAG: hypothetical protein JSW41_02045, partial [Candidatus Aenigmatarchaeota archaeon]
MSKALSNYYRILSRKAKPRFKNADLDSKIKRAGRILESCEFCERGCRINRVKGGLGFCGVGKEWRIFGAHSHFGEEEELIPSGTLFLAGCTMRCVYCQN